MWVRPSPGSRFDPGPSALRRNTEITTADSAPLRAWLFRPSNSNGRAVILLHGAVDTSQGVLGDANILLRHGYTVLTPDSRGHGESGGNIMPYGLREVDDVRRWITWLSEHAHTSEIYRLGPSMGASILLEAIGAGVPLRAVVADSRS